MRTFQTLAVCTLLSLMLISCSSFQNRSLESAILNEEPIRTPTTPHIPWGSSNSKDFRYMRSHIIGVPNEMTLIYAKGKGIQTIIDLRPSIDEDFKEKAAHYGMEYFPISSHSQKPLSLETYSSFIKVYQSAEDKIKLLIDVTPQTSACLLATAEGMKSSLTTDSILGIAFSIGLKDDTSSTECKQLVQALMNIAP